MFPCTCSKVWSVIYRELRNLWTRAGTGYISQENEMGIMLKGFIVLKCFQIETLRLQLSRQTEEKLKVMRTLASCQDELAKAVSKVYRHTCMNK